MDLQERYSAVCVYDASDYDAEPNVTVALTVEGIEVVRGKTILKEIWTSDRHTFVAGVCRCGATE